MASETSGTEDDVLEEPYLCYNDIKDQYFKGPEEGKGPYASICVLDPVITVERHHGQYHIAARFNIQATILRYSTQKSDDHEWFFQDICLQYTTRSEEEDLVTKPESDPAAAFTVTRSTNTTVSGQAAVTLSNVPSANVSLGLTRSSALTVEYKMSTWSVSAHRVVVKPPLVLRPKGKIENLKAKMGIEPSDDYHLPNQGKPARYQWFWLGTQNETERLTPDLKHTVERHVVVERIIPSDDFPVDIVEMAKEEIAREEIEGEEIAREESVRAEQTVEEEARLRDAKRRLQKLFKFGFYIQIRVKRRYGRVHRLFLLSSNKVKANFLNPTYKERFDIQVDLRIVANRAKIPLGDTTDITAILNKLKEKYDGKWDQLQGKDLDEAAEQQSIVSPEVEQLEEQVQQQNSQLDQLRNQVQQQDLQLNRLRNQVQQQDSRHNQLRNQVQQQDSQLSQLRNQVQQQSSQLDQLGKQVKQLEEKVQQQNSQLDQLGKQVKQLEEKVQQQNSQLSQLRNQVQQQSSQLSQLLQQVQKLEEQGQQQNSQHEQLRQQVQQLEELVQQQSSQLEQLRQQVQQQR